MTTLEIQEFGFALAIYLFLLIIFFFIMYELIKHDVDIVRAIAIIGIMIVIYYVFYRYLCTWEFFQKFVPGALIPLLSFLMGIAVGKLAHPNLKVEEKQYKEAE